MKKFLLTTFVVLVLTQPAVVIAQGVYSPSTGTDPSEGAFDGLTFSDVSALASCAGVDDLLTNAVGGIQDSIAEGVGNVLEDVTFFGVNVGKLFGSVTGGGEEKVKDQGLRTKEGCLDRLAYVAGQKILADMTKKTLNWVNTGFDGNPLYVRDINSLLKSIKNEQVAQFLPDVQKADPIFGNALRSIITKQVTGKVDGYLNKALSTPEAVAYKNFTEDFTQGGWSALLNSSNNPLSSLFRETDNLVSKLNTQSQNTRQELVSNGGFLDLKKCVEYADQGSVGSENGVGLKVGGPRCLRYETRTPGSIIADQVKIITGSPVRQAEQVDELNEVFAAFFDSLLNKLFSKGGLAGLKNSGGGGNGGTGPGNNVVFDSENNPLLSESENAFDSPEFSMGSGQNFDVSRPQMIRAILTAQHNFRNRSADTSIAAAGVIPAMAKLDYCMPGPNPTWQSALPGNMSSLISNLKFDLKDRGDVAIQPFKVIDKVTATERSVTQNSGYFKFEDNNAVFNLGVPDASRAYVGIWFQLRPEPTQSAMVDYFQRAFSTLATELNATYSLAAIGDAFAATGDATMNRGIATTAYRSTASLVPYAQSVNTLLNNYTTSSAKLEGNIAELEAINSEVQELVKIAKARYIAERASAGTPVDMACINKAYEINQTPVKGFARQETGSTDEILSGVRAANNYFYSTL